MIDTIIYIGLIILDMFINYRLINYKVSQLEKKVDKHNNVIERTIKLETEVEEIQAHLK